MADAVASQTLMDGERVAIMKFTSTSDGTGESNVVKVNPASLNPSAAGGACDRVTITKITGLTHGMEVQMKWKATTPVVIETIPQNNSYQQDFSAIGGLTNNAGVTAGFLAIIALRREAIEGLPGERTGAFTAGRPTRAGVPDIMSKAPPPIAIFL